MVCSSLSRNQNEEYPFKKGFEWNDIVSRRFKFGHFKRRPFELFLEPTQFNLETVFVLVFEDKTIQILSPAYLEYMRESYLNKRFKQATNVIIGVPFMSVLKIEATYSVVRRSHSFSLQENPLQQATCSRIQYRSI